MTDISDFRCLELSTTAINVMIHIISMGPELVIGDRDTAKSAIAIDVIIIDQPA